MTDTVRFTGRVIWMNNKRGIGFIERPEQKDIFFHYSAIIMDDPNAFKCLESDDIVSFTIGSNDKGECAIDIRKE